MTDVASVLPLLAVLVPALAIPLILASGTRPNVREAWTALAGVGTFAVVLAMVQSPDTHVATLGSYLGVEG